ncbi:hypothetical protein UAJ10_02845 [Nitrospirillum sp. BR 11164]|uniref:hypothetical protein n=1 Tax=Nitrospirillum sp. BR 11164 TaxID=3104324 RepID=UPI002B000F7A|nr:hypothetical protein [Nitrospirillum sp. BR 11164]MEA1647955.1 hypothetical protein [Nitrospirillum sp. BR 11164]
MMKRACTRTIGCFILGMALAWTLAPAGAGTPPERTYTATEVRADLDTLYQRLQADVFDLYAFTSKADMDRLHQRLKADITTPSTRAQAETRLELLAAAAHQGHTRVEGVYAAWTTYRKAGGLAFPLAVRIKEGRVYVARNLSEGARPAVGDEILAIDGVPVATLLARLRRHISAETPALADSILEYDFPLYLWVTAGARPAYKVTVKPPGAAASDTITLAARTNADMASTGQSRPPPWIWRSHCATPGYWTTASAICGPAPFTMRRRKRARRSGT